MKIVLFSCLLILIVTLTASVATEFNIASIGRLRFNGLSCTAFLVKSELLHPRNPRYWKDSDSFRNIFVSAGHCRREEMVFETNPKKIAVGAFTFWLPQLTYRAFPIAYSSLPLGYDILVGEFRSDWGYPVLPLAFGYIPEAGEQLRIVGYGGKVLQSYTAPFIGYENGMLAIGRVGQKGFSGSPVLNWEGKVIAIAVAMKVEISEPCRYFGECVRLPTYYAIPIDILKGVIQWR